MPTGQDRRDASLDAAKVAGELGGLKAAVTALGETTKRGFEELGDRLESQNGRLRAVEERTTQIGAKMVTGGACERTRRACDLARGAGWRAFAIPTAVGVVVAIVSIALARLAG